MRRLFAVGLLLLAVVASSYGQGNPAGPETEDPPSAPRAYLVPVSLPLTGDKDTRIKRMIDQIVAEAADTGQRPLLVLEFRTSGGKAGEGTQFERALSLARYLVSDRLRRVRTVAYIPQTLRGHGVLVALACEELIVAPEAEFGAAGVGEPYLDATMRQTYQSIAEVRRTVPAAVALGMLDPAVEVYKAETLDGVQYVLQEQLAELQQQAAVSAVDTIKPPGQLATFTGRELRLEHGFASHLASNQRELLDALRLPPDAFQAELSLDGEWHAVRVPLNGPINSKSVDWIERSLQQKLAAGQVNFICLVIDSPGGSPSDSLRLAHFLAEMDPTRVRTVAFVTDEARGDAAIIALACDQLVVSESAQLGGPGAAEFSEETLHDLRVSVRAVAESKERSWSLPVALVDPSTIVYRYTEAGTGEARWLTAEEAKELANPDQWRRGEPLETKDGIQGQRAVELKLARYLASDFREFSQLYHLDEQLEPVEPNWAHSLIERLASPRISGLLLFVAWFALMLEFMSPGLSIAGFLSGLCFLLFFWSNYLHGTAGWLEVLLFLGGVACLLIELFVTPGFGVFGVGGGLMVITSLVLASQTFVIPRNSYQLSQMPSSLLVVLAGMTGGAVCLVVMRRYLPNAPILNRLMLSPPDEHEREALERREASVQFDDLLHQGGVTLTRLNPAGKARFGDRIVNVMSDGELIPPETPVYVSDVQGSRIVVRTYDEPSGRS